MVNKPNWGGWAGAMVGDGGTRTKETGSSSRSVSVVIVETIVERRKAVDCSVQAGWVRRGRLKPAAQCPTSRKEVG